MTRIETPQTVYGRRGEVRLVSNPRDFEEDAVQRLLPLRMSGLLTEVEASPNSIALGRRSGLVNICTQREGVINAADPTRRQLLLGYR